MRLALLAAVRVMTTLLARATGPALPRAPPARLSRGGHGLARRPLPPPAPCPPTLPASARPVTCSATAAGARAADGTGRRGDAFLADASFEGVGLAPAVAAALTAAGFERPSVVQVRESEREWRGQHQPFDHVSLSLSTHPTPFPPPPPFLRPPPPPPSWPAATPSSPPRPGPARRWPTWPPS
jgi:hypothetical protein